MGLREAEDEEILEWAVGERRALLTHNIRDFVPLAAAYAERGWEHHGVVVSDRVPFRVLLARTVRLLGRRQAEDLVNAVEWLQNNR